MQKKVLLSSGSGVLVLAMIVLHSAVGLQGQTKPAPTGGSGLLLVDTDDSCRLVLDGQDKGVIKPDQAIKINASLGDHILKCTVEGIPDLVWRKVVAVKTSEQVVALILLKALHIQYEEATAKLEKETNKTTAAVGSLSAPQKGVAPPEASLSSPQKATVSNKSATGIPAVVVLNVQQAIHATNDASRDLKALGPAATQAQRDEITQRILAKMAPMISNFAADNGLGMIVDISNPWPKGKVIWIGKQPDITKSIVDVYNGHSARFVPSATNQKVGTINVEQAIFATDEGKQEFSVLNKKLEPKQTELKGMNTEIERLERQINTQASADSRNYVEREIKTKQEALNRAIQGARESFDTQQNDIAQRVLAKMAPMIVKVATDNGFGMIVDISNPWPEGEVLWAGYQSDITKSIVEVYNGHSARFVPSATNQKVGTINVDQAIFATDECKQEFSALNKKLEPKQAELKGMNAEIEGLKARLSAEVDAQASADSRNYVEREIKTKQEALNRAVQDARDSAQTQQNEITKRILNKMAPMIVKIATDNGFGMIVDASRQWPKGSVMWGGPQVDVTKSVVLAYNLQVPVDRNAPVAAQAPAPQGGAYDVSTKMVGTADSQGASAGTCPDWSSEFDQIDDPALVQPLRDNQQRGWDNVLQAGVQQGTSLQQQIAQGEQVVERMRTALQRDRQIWQQIGVGPEPALTAEVCQRQDAAGAALCDERLQRNGILGMEGTLELIRCRAGISH